MTEQIVNFSPPIESRAYIDGFGNACTRIEAPAGLTTISTDFQIYDLGKPDVVALDAVQHDIKDLPDDVLVFLLGSRYCDTDRLGDFAWATFGGTQPGWSRVQAICDFVHSHIASTIKMQMLFEQRMADTPTRRAFAGTSPISRSRFAAA